MPFAIECFTGSGYSNIYVLLSGFVNGYNRLFVGWIDGFEGLAVNALDPFVIDETREITSVLEDM